MTLGSDATVAGSTLRNSALAPSGSYSVSQTYVVSGVSPGPNSLFLKADSQGLGAADAAATVIETNEGNNLARVAIVLPTYPDLAISNGSIGTISTNQNGSFNIPATFTVSNLGTNPALSTWSDYGYLSSNGVHDTSSLVLGGTARNTNLAGGSSYNVAQTFVTSGVGPGSFTVFLKADGRTGAQQTGSGVVVEGNEANNSVGIAVTLPGYPDLTVTSASAGTVTLAQNGTFTVPVSFTIGNSGGSGAAASWADHVYLSSNGSLDSSSTSIGAAARGTTLAAASSYTVNQNITTTTAPGTYTLFVKADGKPSAVAAGNVTEASESNNANAGIALTLPAYPDLVISSPSVGTITKNVNNTWNIPVTFTVTNSGGSAAQPNWSDFGYLSANGVLDVNSSPIGSAFRGTALAASASYTITYTYVTAAVSPGGYTVFVRTDGRTSPSTAGFVTEGNESNNTTAGLAVTLN